MGQFSEDEKAEEIIKTITSLPFEQIEEIWENTPYFIAKRMYSDPVKKEAGMIGMCRIAMGEDPGTQETREKEAISYLYGEDIFAEEDRLQRELNEAQERLEKAKLRNKGVVEAVEEFIKMNSNKIKKGYSIKEPYKSRLGKYLNDKGLIVPQSTIRTCLSRLGYSKERPLKE